MQRVFAWPYRAILAFLIWTGVRPWQLTMLSLLLNVLTGWQILEGNWLVAGFLLLFAGLCDVFDGSVAATGARRNDRVRSWTRCWIGSPT